MRLWKKIWIILTILICFIIQGTVFRGLSIGSVSPNLMLIVTISLGFMQGKIPGLWIGFFCGFLLDVFSGGLIGFHSVIFLCVGYTAGCCSKLFYNEELRVPMLLVAAGDLIYGCLVYGMEFLLRGRTQFFHYLSRIIIPEMIYTVLLTVLLYRILFKINKRFAELEMKERDSIWLRR